MLFVFVHIDLVDGERRKGEWNRLCLIVRIFFFCAYSGFSMVVLATMKNVYNFIKHTRLMQAEETEMAWLNWVFRFIIFVICVFLLRWKWVRNVAKTRFLRFLLFILIFSSYFSPHLIWHCVWFLSHNAFTDILELGFSNLSIQFSMLMFTLLFVCRQK